MPRFWWIPFSFLPPFPEMQRNLQNYFYVCIYNVEVDINHPWWRYFLITRCSEMSEHRSWVLWARQSGGIMIYKHQVRIWVLNWVWVRELPSKGNYNQRTIVFQTESISRALSCLSKISTSRVWASSRFTSLWPFWGRGERRRTSFLK